VSGYHAPAALEQPLAALRKDLERAEGPQISTVRNYNFAILPYEPDLEFPLRRAIQELCEALRDAGWTTGTIPLHGLLLERLRGEGRGFIDGLVAREKRLAGAADPWRGLRALKERIVNLIEGSEGIAADVVREVKRLVESAPDPKRVVIFIGRAGALYPFLRTSALLKHIAGHTEVPIVLLYPGTIVGESGLSFMGVLPPDRDYRPRIYR
jgi:hypothetical protein